MNVKIAVPINDGVVFEHFGKAKVFKIYDIQESHIISTEVTENEDCQHDAVALWLLMRGVNAVICGDIGPGALGALTAAGIVAIAGVDGSPDQAIEKFIDGKLLPTSTPTCSSGGGCGSKCGSSCGGCHGCHGHK